MLQLVEQIILRYRFKMYDLMAAKLSLGSTKIVNADYVGSICLL